MDDQTYFFFTDETNKDPSGKSRFFIYGGVFVPASALAPLHNAVEEIRERHGFQASDELKFALRSCPAQVSAQALKEAKQETLVACRDLGLIFVACLTLHDIAKNKKADDLIGWGANTVFRAFNRFLGERDATGIVVCDRLPFESGYRYLRDKFQLGLEYAGHSPTRLDRILLFASSCSGASHASSAVDVLLGAFRYCVNEDSKTTAPHEIMAAVAPMLWADERDGVRYVREQGLLFRPINIKVSAYQEMYDELADRLQKFSND